MEDNPAYQEERPAEEHAGQTVILSPGTARYDRGYKKDTYARCGVREYWIADPANKTLEQYLLRGGDRGVPLQPVRRPHDFPGGGFRARPLTRRAFRRDLLYLFINSCYNRIRNFHSPFFPSKKERKNACSLRNCQ